jgi:SAM-dependent methyltransferase
MDAPFRSVALSTAMELGLFWMLEDSPTDAVGVAVALGIPMARCRYWLQLLEDAGLLERDGTVYKPSEVARHSILRVLSQESWALLAEETRRRLPSLRDLTLHIRDSGSVWPALGLEPPMFYADMAKDPELAARFTRMLYELHEPLATDLSTRLNLQGVTRVMDLGGGSGVMSMALLRLHPRLNAVVVDIANVCAAGRRIAEANELQDRISYHPADFLTDDLPSGFDMVLECDVDVYSEALISKIWDALKPGGRFVIIDQLAPEEGTAPPTRVHWAFRGSLGDPRFRFLTADEVKAQLVKAGFEISSETPLPVVPEGPERVTRGMIMIEARKAA